MELPAGTSDSTVYSDVAGGVTFRYPVGQYSSAPNHSLIFEPGVRRAGLIP